MSDFREHRYLGRINLEAGVPPSQFLLYNHVTDLFYYGQGGYGFSDLRATLTLYLTALQYEIILFYSVSQGIQFAAPDMAQRFQDATTEARPSTYGTAPSGLPPSPAQGQESAALRDITSLSRLLRQSGRTNAPIRAAVIIERVQNIVSANPSAEERIVLDHIQSWSQITNGNISILVADAAELENLPAELTGSHRSGLEVINIGLPTQVEINQLLMIAENEGTPVDSLHRSDIIQRLAGCNAIKIYDYLNEIRHRSAPLNLQTLREVMTQTPDIWPELLTERRLSELSRHLLERVKGQEYAVEQLLQVLGNVASNIQNQINSGRTEERPLAYFFFAGPTGVGKTEIFRVLSQEWNRIRTLKINMPEYQEEHASARLFGAPPGYIGYGKGELGQFLHENPVSVILFDEFEKAHPKVRMNFLTMLEGSLTTGDGVKLDMSRSLLIFTSNAGAAELLPIAPNMSDSEQANIRNRNSELIRADLRSKGTPPELIGRLLNSIISFNHLTREVAGEVITMNLERVQRQIGRDLIWDGSVTDYLFDYYERESHLGARALADHIMGAILGRLRKLLRNVPPGPITVYVDEATTVQVVEGEAVGDRPRFTAQPRRAPTPRLRPVQLDPEDEQRLQSDASQCVVAVLRFATRNGQTRFLGAGSGIIVTPDGQVLTCAHVVGEATRFAIQRPGNRQWVDMEIVAVSSLYDLALLRPAKPTGEQWPHLQPDLGSGLAETGDPVLTFGYPQLFLDEQGAANLTEPLCFRGWINGIRQAERIFQLQCPINPGMSGGPLISARTGQLIGLAVARHRESSEMGYAIMGHSAAEFLRHLGVLGEVVYTAGPQG